jgi:hypothetical protein
VIGFAGEKCPGFELADVALPGGQLAVEIFQEFVALLGVGFLFCQADVRLDVAGDGSQPVVRGNLFLGSFAVAKNGLRFFLVVPEVGLRDAGFE